MQPGAETKLRQQFQYCRALVSVRQTRDERGEEGGGLPLERRGRCGIGTSGRPWVSLQSRSPWSGSSVSRDVRRRASGGASYVPPGRLWRLPCTCSWFWSLPESVVGPDSREEGVLASNIASATSLLIIDVYLRQGGHDEAVLDEGVPGVRHGAKLVKVDGRGVDGGGGSAVRVLRRQALKLVRLRRDSLERHVLRRVEGRHRNG